MRLVSVEIAFDKEETSITGKNGENQKWMVPFQLNKEHMQNTSVKLSHEVKVWYKGFSLLLCNAGL